MKYKAEYNALLFSLLYLGIPLCLPLTSSAFATEDRPLRPGEPLWIGFTSACVLCLLLPAGITRNIVGCLILWYSQKDYPMSTTGHAGRDYLIAINITLAALKFADFVYLRVPEDTAHRVNASGVSIENGRSIRDSSYRKRLQWAASLFSTLRGVGWNWKVKNVEDVPPGTTRWYDATDSCLFILIRVQDICIQASNRLHLQLCSRRFPRALPQPPPSPTISQ